MTDKFYITTPIYYANAEPHLGTFYTTVVADALARYHRARARENQVFFLTGTDEHGQKIEQLAQKAELLPKIYCDRVVDKFKETWKRAGISNDRFIRTTDDDHEVAVHEIWRRLKEAGDIYLGEYDGLYCVGCEDFKADGDDDVVTENGAKNCRTHRRPLERLSKEPNYFFRLSKYEKPLLEFFEANPNFIRPESRRNEVVELVKRGLRDLSISRTSVDWGIPVPDDPAHTVYVWIDALTNYITALGGASAVEEGGVQSKLWRSCTHLIAKDILRFHAVYWTAMLMAAKLPFPRQILCHGYWTVKGEKIAKSVPATRVDPNAIGAEIGYDPLRYFVLREIPLGNDGDFSYEALLQRYESDLGNDLGNLLNRTVSMVWKSFPDGNLPATDHRIRFGEASLEQAEKEFLAVADVTHPEVYWDVEDPSGAIEETWKLIRAGNAYIEHSAPWKLAKSPYSEKKAELSRVLGNACEVLSRVALYLQPVMPEVYWDVEDPSGAIEETWKLIRAGNAYIEHSAPWKLAKSPYPEKKAELIRVLGNACEVLSRVALYLQPVMPEVAQKILHQIGRTREFGAWPTEKWHQWFGGMLGQPKVLFPRLEPEQRTALLAKWNFRMDKG